MVSYYNPLAMYSKSHCANMYPTSNPWYSSNYHQPPNPQLFGGGGAAGAINVGSDNDGQPPMYYPHHMFQSSPDWPSHDSFSTPPSTNSSIIQASTPGNGGTGLNMIQNHHLHHHHHNQNPNGGSSDHLNEGIHGMPSPPITVSGSEMSSPGGNGSNNNGLHGGSSSPHQTSIRPTPAKSPYEWIKRTSYQNQTNPGRCRFVFKL